MLSRKEQLALFKQQREAANAAASSSSSTATAAKSKSKSNSFKPKSATATATTTATATSSSVRSKVHMSAKTTIFQSNSRHNARNDRNVVMAGKKKIAATTPIGKLQARLRAKQSAPTSKSTAEDKENTKKCNKNLFGSDDEGEEKMRKDTHSDFNKEITSKLDEADYLHKKHGCHVARAYLEELPKDDSCSHLQLLSKAVYWLTWIKIEQSDHQWDRAEKLFMQAESLVRTPLDKKVIAAAYDTFRQEADSILESKMDSILEIAAPATTQNSVHSFVPKLTSTQPLKRKRDVENSLSPEVDSTEVEGSSNNAFQGVNVSNTRKKFEDGIHGEMKDSESISTTKVSVKDLAANLMHNMSNRRVLGKALAGGVALPGMPTAMALVHPMKNEPESKRPCKSPEVCATDELSNLLGIGNDEDDDDDDSEDVNNQDEDDSSTSAMIPNVSNDGGDKFDSCSTSSDQPFKKLCRARAPVRVVDKSDDIFSDSDNEDDHDDVTTAGNEVIQSEKSLEKNLQIKTTKMVKISAADCVTSQRKTRSGVCFAEQNYNTPSKNRLDKNLKRKVTPFKPHIDDIVLSPSS